MLDHAVTFVNLYSTHVSPERGRNRVGILAARRLNSGEIVITASLCSKKDLPKFSKAEAKAHAIQRLFTQGEDRYRFVLEPDSNDFGEVIKFLRKVFGTTFRQYFPFPVGVYELTYRIKTLVYALNKNLDLLQKDVALSGIC